MNVPLILLHSAEFLGRFDFSEPLHLLLTDYYREKRHLGAKDRRIIGDYIYAVIRNFRWLSYLLNLEETHENFLINQQSRLRYVLLVHRLKNLEGGKLSFNHQDLMSEIWPEVEKIEIRPSERADVNYSIPEWIWEKFCTQWDEETVKKVANTLLQTAEIHLRQQKADPKSSDWSQKYRLRKGNLLPMCWRAPIFASVRQWDIYRKGIVEIQDEGSQLITYAANPKNDETIIDLCAGAGGKTLQLAAMANENPGIIATDKIKRRTIGLMKRLQRARIKNVQIKDYTEVLNQFRGRADLVLTDVPCSGTGVLRRNPDDKFRLKPEQLKSLLRTQRLILRDAVRLLRAGGRLVYGTCSLLYEENEGQIKKFLKRYPQFELIDEQAIFADFGIKLEKEDNQSLGFTLLPHLYDTDGFYMAVLRRIR